MNTTNLTRAGLLLGALGLTRQNPASAGGLAKAMLSVLEGRGS